MHYITHFTRLIHFRFHTNTILLAPREISIVCLAYIILADTPATGCFQLYNAKSGLKFEDAPCTTHIQYEIQKSE